MKRRKRTNKDVPAKGRLRDFADQLWSLAVRAEWGHRCAVCGKGKCEAHHIVPRQHEATRYDTANGIALCAHCHQFDADLSPHQNAAGWMAWLETHHIGLAQRYKDNPRPTFSGTTNVLHYLDTLRRLRAHVPPEDFDAVCGKKFSEWLLTSE